MKIGLIFLVIGIFLSAVLAYQLQNFSPFNTEKIQDLIVSENITSDDKDKIDDLIREKVVSLSVFEYLNDSSYIVFVLLNIVIILFFSSSHIFIDKLFFKNFFESPNYFRAIRRGILLSITLSLVIYIRLLKVDISNVLLIPLASFILEVILSSINLKRKEAKPY